jgi:hypothetical protein
LHEDRPQLTMRFKLGGQSAESEDSAPKEAQMVVASIQGIQME